MVIWEGAELMLYYVVLSLDICFDFIGVWYNIGFSALIHTVLIPLQTATCYNVKRPSSTKESVLIPLQTATCYNLSCRCLD